MTGIVLPSLFVVCGICLHAGISHLLIAARRRTAVHLLFGLLCLLVVAYVLFSARSYGASSPAAFLRVWRQQLVIGDLWCIVFVWFVACYSEYRPVRILLAHNAVCVIAIVFNLILPSTLLYSEIHGLESRTLPWGELVPVLDANISQYALLQYSVGLLSFLFSYECCRRVFVRGSYGSALFLAAATTIQCVAFLIYALMDFAELSFMSVGEFAFVSFILLMSFRLADEFELADRMLQHREGRLQSILDTAADAIVTINQRGIIEHVNPAIEKIFGYTPAEIVGKNVKVLMGPPYCHLHDGYLSRYLETGEAHIIGVGREVTGRRKDGSPVPIYLAVTEIHSFGLFTGIIRDISESKELQKYILEVAGDEQDRLGRELHDGTGQELTGLSLFAGTLSDALDNAQRRDVGGSAAWVFDEAGYRRLLKVAKRLLEGLTAANRNVQQLAHGIMPVQIDAEDLSSALSELAVAVDADENVTCLFDCPRPIVVQDSTTATHLYRIAQEALNNSLRHGQAEEIHISLSKDHEMLTLAVTDNGIGFNPGAQTQNGAASGGMGLRIMRYRAEIIGGVLRIERNESGGTTVICTVGF